MTRRRDHRAVYLGTPGQTASGRAGQFTSCVSPSPAAWAGQTASWVVRPPPARWSRTLRARAIEGFRDEVRAFWTWASSFRHDSAGGRTAASRLPADIKSRWFELAGASSGLRCGRVPADAVLGGTNSVLGLHTTAARSDRRELYAREQSKGFVTKCEHPGRGLLHFDTIARGRRTQRAGLPTPRAAGSS
jgi:hypothetical protein